MHLPKSWNFFILCFLATVLSAVAKNPLENMQLGGFRVPEYNTEGEMVSQFFGESASMHSSGDVKIDMVRVEYYSEGEVALTVKTPYCFYNQKTRDARSDAPITANMKGVSVSGTGFKLGVESRTVELLNESKVVLEGMIQVAESSDEDEPSEGSDVTTITSKKLFLNYHDRTARFVETVGVDNPELNLTCEELDMRFSEENKMEQIDALNGCHVKIFDRATVKTVTEPQLELLCETLQLRFNESNKVDQIDALGGIRLEVFDVMTQTDDPFMAQGDRGTNDTTVITSEKLFLNQTDRAAKFVNTVHVKDAELVMDSDTLELRYNESNEINWIEAVGSVRLLTEGREAIAGRASYDAKSNEFLLQEEPRIIEGRNMLFGDRIRFWRSEKRMVCEPSARLVVIPDDKVKTDIFEY
ncbi:MAG: LPS export ABC transporter periplasmic protein LptC [Kiritimatiellaceae bacterium]|nr:LPS export ABC transporter periplasmic protein LptC [Kiritimatiellaceae bacterium]